MVGLMLKGNSQGWTMWYFDIKLNSGLNGTLGNPAYDFPFGTINGNTWHLSFMVWRNSSIPAF